MKINPITICSYYVELFFNDVKLSSATAFSYKKNDTKYLVTNYHVAYGRNALTGKPLDKNAAIPNRMIMHYITKTGKQNCYEIKYDEQNNPFIYKTIDSKIIDIAVLPLEDFDGIGINEIDALFQEIQVNEEQCLEIAEELFVIGYPKGISVFKTPIWKRGSVASEPDVPIDGMNCFYIDSSTRDGMSGSPVIYYNKDGQYKTKEILFGVNNNKIFKFIGIYSGRDSEQDIGVIQLGIVWKKELIEDIIESIRY